MWIESSGKVTGVRDVTITATTVSDIFNQVKNTIAVSAYFQVQTLLQYCVNMKDVPHWTIYATKLKCTSKKLFLSLSL